MDRPVKRTFKITKNVSPSCISVYMKNLIFFCTGALSVADTVHNITILLKDKEANGSLKSYVMY